MPTTSVAGRATGALIHAELRIAGRRRTFTLRLPSSRYADGPTPLALVLHGRGSTGHAMQRISGLDTRADRWGIAVAYPDGRRRNWADSRHDTDPGADADHDVEFLRGVIDWCAKHHGCWPDRTIVAGLSSGAFMAHRLAVQAGEKVAVLAAIAGAMPAAVRDHKPTHAVSVLLINGTADTIVPLTGRYSRRHRRGGQPAWQLLSQRDTINYWRAVDGLDDINPTTSITAADQPGWFAVTQQTFTGGVAETEVCAWAIQGAGHTWPGSNPSRFHRLLPVGLTAQNFHAADEICRFALPRLHPAATRHL